MPLGFNFSVDTGDSLSALGEAMPAAGNAVENYGQRMPSDDQLNKSRRAIDLHSAEVLGRFDERLRHLQDDVADLKEEVKGKPGESGLAERVRLIFFVAGGVTILASWFPWVYDHFIAKTVGRGVFGEEVREKWIKESTKRIRIYSKDKGQWEYFYAIEEKHKPDDDGP